MDAWAGRVGSSREDNVLDVCESSSLVDPTLPFRGAEKEGVGGGGGSSISLAKIKNQESRINSIFQAHLTRFSLYSIWPLIEVK